VSLGDLGERTAAVAAGREVRNKNDALAGAVVDDVLVLALGEVVVVLNRGDGEDLTGPLDLALYSCGFSSPGGRDPRNAPKSVCDRFLSRTLAASSDRGRAVERNGTREEFQSTTSCEDRVA
jgi:hypothetical protein